MTIVFIIVFFKDCFHIFNGGENVKFKAIRAMECNGQEWKQI